MMPCFSRFVCNEGWYIAGDLLSNSSNVVDAKMSTSDYAPTERNNITVVNLLDGCPEYSVSPDAEAVHLLDVQRSLRSGRHRVGMRFLVVENDTCHSECRINGRVDRHVSSARVMDHSAPNRSSVSQMGMSLKTARN